MTGHRTFSEVTRGFTPERRARVAARAAALRETMTLEELRKARSLSQEELAATLNPFRHRPYNFENSLSEKQKAC
jgi:hypothetical protein